MDVIEADGGVDQEQVSSVVAVAKLAIALVTYLHALQATPPACET